MNFKKISRDVVIYERYSIFSPNSLWIYFIIFNIRDYGILKRNSHKNLQKHFMMCCEALGQMNKKRTWVYVVEQIFC